MKILGREEVIPEAPTFAVSAPNRQSCPVLPREGRGEKKAALGSCHKRIMKVISSFKTCQTPLFYATLRAGSPRLCGQGSHARTKRAQYQFVHDAALQRLCSAHNLVQRPFLCSPQPQPSSMDASGCLLSGVQGCLGLPGLP